MRKLILAGLALIGAMAVLPAQAGHVGVSIGVGLPWPGYYYGPAWPYPYYGAYGPYAPWDPYHSGYAGYGSPVVVQTQPNTYIEPAPVAQGGQDDSWYYCEKAKAYYPYVRQCPAGWQRVPSRPPQ